MIKRSILVLETNISPVPEKYKIKEPYKRLQKQCFPIFSLLLALGNPTVDYFSLDVEGTEIDILRTIPWDKVNVNVDFNVNLMILLQVIIQSYML